ncbi:DNA starvation/stationary phase protection protein [Gracilibacillus sp. S3-1-1]|uniref:DNA starvation/stationary phase protection protein n=1 Tax=Gracilibacillus pellucidus TaxID=3095368 RepID=A0ACC6M8L9_9BACI|nr:DNA starvation/stationary phase protection protein [Gracilibacillus sp. S3-1-1]MDX8047310.1 DNA starvation/stationary phase protection protein [Gracilibacillus sp. S3-1-1]
MDNQKLINFLNQLLSNHFVLYVKLHRYHWFVQGRNFYQLHAVFEEMYDQIAADLDEVAERVLAIDGKPLAVMSKYLEETTLVEASADDKETEIIEQLMADYKQVIAEIKEEGLSLADEIKDEPTADLLISLQGRYEKYVWMLSAYLAYE